MTDKLQAIYQPKGRAGEYAKWAVNLRQRRGFPCARIVASDKAARPAPSVSLRECGTATASAGGQFVDVEANLPFAPTVAGDVSPRPPSAVELHERLTAPARTWDKRIGLSGRFATTRFAVAHLVPRTRDDLQVLRAVIQLIAVYVMHQFGAFQAATEHLLSHQPMLVSVARNVGIRVVRALHPSVAVGTDCRLVCLSYHIAPPEILTPIITPCYKTAKKEVIHASYL